MPGWFYAPSEWLAHSTSAKLRRAMGFWFGISFVTATIASWSERGNVAVVWALQIGALLLLCWTIVTTETPVETEDDA